MAALAAKADVEARLGRDLTDVEAGEQDKWIAAILEEASLLVATYCGRSFGTGPVPDEVRVVTSRVAARAVATTRTDSAASQSDQADIWQRSVTYQPDATSGGVWLTKSDKQMLSGFVTSGRVFSIDVA